MAVYPSSSLFPEWLPFHPWRWWIHVRNVYFPMAYLYGLRFQTPVTPLILSLRSELYLQPYDTIPFHTLSNAISPIDLYHPHTTFFTVLSYPLGALEWVMSRWGGWVRRKALERLAELVKMEDENTGYQTIGPVSKAFHMVVRFCEEGYSAE
jgi:lanosterol synthase